MPTTKEIFTYDRRESLRVMSKVKANIYLDKANISKGNGISTLLYDLSETGALIKAAKPIAVSKNIFIQFKFPFPYEDVSIKANIAWEDKNKSLFGLKFIGLNKEQKLFLDDYINRYTVTRKIKLDRRRKDRRTFNVEVLQENKVNKRKVDRRKIFKHIQEPKYFPITIDEYIRDLTDSEYVAEIESTRKIAKVVIKQYDLLINGKLVDTKNYEYFPFMDKVIVGFETTRGIIQSLKKGEIPKDFDKYVFARYSIGLPDTNQKAIKSAFEAWKIYSIFPIAKRKKILEDIHELLLHHKEKLIELMVIEGHPRKLAEWEFSGMELAYRKDNLDFFKNEMVREVARTKDERLYIVRKPEGVLCVSTPKNAPSSSSLIAGFALLAGNTIIVKPPLRCPISTIFLWENVVHAAAKANGAPDGIVNIVIGNSKKIFEEWCNSDIVKCILHFGDSKTGIEIGKAIYNSGKKPILELSGNDYMIVWKDADLDKSTDALLDAFLGSTQICMSPKKALIHEEIYERFKRLFLEKVKSLKTGLPSDPATVLSPVGKISEFFQFLEDAVNKGAKCLCGGHRIGDKGKKDDKGIFIAPTVIELEGSLASKMLCIKEEIFFPLLPIICVKAYSKENKDEEIFNRMIKLVNDNEYGLRTSLWTNSDEYISRFSEFINSSGFIRVNSRHIGFSSYLSNFGGPGKSGGPFGEMNYMWQKTSKLQGVSITRNYSKK